MKGKNKAKNSKEAWETALDEVIVDLTKDQKPYQVPIVKDIFRAAAKLAMESAGTLSLKIASTTLKELRFSFKTFYPHRYSPKITMFGSARVPEDTPLYAFAKEFAEKAVSRKYMVVTGGGPGIMAAGNEGADQAGFGLNIRLPVEQEPNPFIEQDGMLIHYKYFFTRKLFLVKEAWAFAFFPGGFGTFDEAFEVLTLLQTGKTNMIPVVLVEPPGLGYWEKFVEYMEGTLLKMGFISESDRSLYKAFTDAGAALDHIDHFYSTYHSMRFVGNKLAIRMKRKLSDAELSRINTDFASLAEGPFVQSGPLPEEANEPELKDLHRLVFPFDRKDYGSLRRLIDALNDSTL